MQSDSLWTTSIRSCETTFSLSVARSRRGSRYGWIACIFCQNGSMSTTRSLRIGRFPIAETTGTCPSAAMSAMRVLQASTAPPSTRIPHEPQIIIRQLFRYASVPSTRSLTTSSVSSSVASSDTSTSYGRSARSPVEAS